MKKGFMVVLAIFWGWVFTMVLSVSMPYNPIAKTYLKNRRYIKGLLPEGFAFFTRDPREEKLYFLVEENGHLIQDPRLKNATLKNMFGIRRTGRILQLVYSTQMLGPYLKWHAMDDLKGNTFDSDIFDTTPVEIKDAKLVHYKKFVIIKKKIKPWAYRNISKGISENDYFVKVDVINK